MKTKSPSNSILVSALLGLTMAGMVQGATLRYQGGGDYTNVLAITGNVGWYNPSAPGTPTTLPGSGDTIHFNYGGETVILTTVAPDVARFRGGVDEPGHLVVTNGGKLKAVGTGANAIGYNGGTVVGTLTIYSGGEVISSSPLEVGRLGIGSVMIDGGTLTLNHHLWVGSGSGGSGTIIITNGGVLDIPGTGGNGMLGLGTIDAVNASGGLGIIKVQSGGSLKLFNISGTAQHSIQGASVLDISGSGVVTIPGDRVATMTGYVTAGKITSYGGTGTVVIDYNNTNPGFTTLTATGGYVPPTDLTWDPAGNPSTTGLWSENANWSPDRYKPVAATKVSFNKTGAIPCLVTDSAAASYVLMGQDGPGGTLIVTNGGTLACGAGDSTIIGNNSNAVLVVAPGGTANFATNLYIGVNPEADGTFRMDGGSATVGGLMYLGWFGGKGTVQIKGGTLNLATWDEFEAIHEGSTLDVSTNGVVVINGDRTGSINYFVAMGRITANGGAGAVVVDYNKINLGKTTVYAQGLDLPPAQVVWNPAANPGSDGMWDVANNWNIGMLPGNVTTVVFNVPDAIPCIVTNAAVAGYFAMGDSSGPGGTLIVTNGGSLTTMVTHWSGIGYSSNGLMSVESGSSASFAEHLWIGFSAGAEGTLVVNGGTVSVSGMFGLGWNGGKGTAQIKNGTLNLAQWHPTDSIKGQSVLDIVGSGAVVITGNYAGSISNFVALGRITANGGSNVAYSFDSTSNKTIVQAAPTQQAISDIHVSGANMTITAQTTPGHFYHIESRASLTGGAWAPVAGSSIQATGSSTTFTFPSTGDQTFYRTVSP